MFDGLEDIKKYGAITAVIVSIIAIFASGIFFGVVYHIMDITHDSFLANDCVISGNAYVDSCQDLWGLSLYPFLALREILIWFSFFFIFALVIGMLVLGYQSGTHPVMMGVLITFVTVLTYIGIEVSNIYRSMLEITVFRDIMTPFTIYNKVMLAFPWFTFIVGLLAVMLSIVNYQRAVVNNASRDELNY